MNYIVKAESNYRIKLVGKVYYLFKIIFSQNVYFFVSKSFVSNSKAKR